VQAARVRQTSLLALQTQRGGLHEIIAACRCNPSARLATPSGQRFLRCSIKASIGTWNEIALILVCNPLVGSWVFSSRF
jgi:hypothetical protein